MKIDWPMVGQLSADEYYVALEKLGPCSKLSGRVTAALECSALKEEITIPSGENAIREESVHVARLSDEYTIITDTCGKLRWASGEADGIAPEARTFSTPVQPPPPSGKEVPDRAYGRI